MKAVCCAAALLVPGARDYIFALVVPVIMPSPGQRRGLWRGGVQDSIFQSAGTMTTKRRRQSKQNSGTSLAVRVGISDDNADEAEEEPGQCEDLRTTSLKSAKLEMLHVGKNLTSVIDHEGCKNYYRGWMDLRVPPEELRPAATLTIGQCFNWRLAAPDCWVGVLGSEVVAIRQTPSTTLFRSLSLDTTQYASTEPGSAGANTLDSGKITENTTTATLAATLRDYFCLGAPLAPLYRRWSEGDSRMAAVAACIPGVRVVRQEPVECIFSFICSSNNNIPRITLMLNKLRRTYGELLLNVGEGGLAATGLLGNMECEEWARMPLELYSFPTVNELAAYATETDLREMGFGYRAKYIVESATLMQEGGGEDWALNMRGKGRDDVRQQLMTLSGVGPKVADCVALFSLDQASAIPVDVHVWRIACRDYDPSLQDCKSLTPTVYSRVGNLFRDRFGQQAGWAHSLLFAAELSGFKDMLSPEMQHEMDEFRREERDSKVEAKAQRARKNEEKTRSDAKKGTAKPRQREGARSRGRGTR